MGWHLQLALALSLASALGPTQDAPAESASAPCERPYRAEVMQALALLQRGDSLARAACTEHLSSLSRAAAATLVEALALPQAFVDPSAPGPGGAAQSILVEILRERPVSDVVPVLHEILRREVPFEAQRRLIEVAGLLGDASTCAPLLELVAAMEPARRQLRAIQRELEAALAQILLRYPEACTALAVSSEELEPLLQSSVARAIGSAGAGQGLAGLERMLGRALELDRTVLEAIGRLDPADPECQRGCPELLAWHLTSIDGAARRLAAASLARHGGVEQVDGLTVLLDDGDPRVRRAAEQALGQIAGVSLGSAPAGWNAWFLRERDWYRERAPALLEEVAAADPARAFEALRELSVHALFRRELAPRLAPGLERGDAGLASAACRALARLGGPTALAALEAALSDERSEVARAAEVALRALERG